MTNDERRFRRKSLAAVGIGIVASVALLSLLYMVGTHRCLDKTLGFGQETMVFLKNACEKYDRYEQGRKTEATHNLDAALESFATFLPPDRFEVNDDLVEEYVHTESLSGMLVMDADGHMVAHYDIDGRDPLMLWREELACSSIASMYRGSKVSYSTAVERRGVDFAVSAVPYGDGVALGYRSLAFWVVVLLARNIADHRNLVEKDKQLGIINAISAIYDSTFLLHLDTLEIEGINMSPAIAKMFAEHSEAYDFMDTVCRDIVSPESREAVVGLVDISTLRERMEGVPYLAAEVRDCRGTWYSLQVVPQHRDEQGRLDSVVVATHNISMVKHAEELSYQDKLTGLRNRNYLESRGDSLVNEDLPVSVIMVDCNYLKRTNDIYGHEMGDELLRRTASVLRRVAGADYLPMRVGGDEFLLVCPHTDNESALGLEQDLRLGLAAVSDETLTVSASIGVATVETAGNTLADVYRVADHNMYREKRMVHAQGADC